MTISPETLRLAVMHERYGSGDAQILGRAVRDLHKQLTEKSPHWPVEEGETPGEPFDANDDQSPMGVI